MKRSYNREGDYLIACANYRARIRSIGTLALRAGIAYTTLRKRIIENFGGMTFSEFRALVCASGMTDEEIVKLVRGKC